jgi:hypothetical protein
VLGGWMLDASGEEIAEGDFVNALDLEILNTLRICKLTVTAITDRVLHRKLVGVVTSAEIGLRVDDLKNDGLVATEPGRGQRIVRLTTAGLTRLNQEASNA